MLGEKKNLFSLFRATYTEFNQISFIWIQWPEFTNFVNSGQVNLGLEPRWGHSM